MDRSMRNIVAPRTILVWSLVKFFVCSESLESLNFEKNTRSDSVKLISWDFWVSYTVYHQICTDRLMRNIGAARNILIGDSIKFHGSS